MPSHNLPIAKATSRRRTKRDLAAPPQGPNVTDRFPVVGIGASAGGLEACTRLMGVLPADSGMAFILVQHLDPTHESLMVDLLSKHTAMPVKQATEGMRIERNCFYIIPPGASLSVADGCLHLSQPQARRGQRLPFDFLLQSLAKDYGARAICVVLSGTGADGSAGLVDVHEKSGLVIAQDPAEADYDGMPRSAIATGLVDLILPIAAIPDALVRFVRTDGEREADDLAAQDPSLQDSLPRIIELLRTQTPHDFTFYKPGTLRRRIERRMAMADIEAGRVDLYCERLSADRGELEQLARDLLINVTSFFRDPEVFDFLAREVVPVLIAERGPDNPLRIWVVGCSTGEETYSLAMLFREQIAAAQVYVKLQIFASDVDPDAITRAREGLYPQTIVERVSPSRLAQFFSREDNHYRVSPDLRASVVFTVQDVLSDPPFSRLDLISCRNVLIYLRPEAQARIISMFHFALREGGVLVLGNAETIGAADSRYAAIAKGERVYRHIGRGRAGELGFLMRGGEGVRAPARPGVAPPPSRQAALADFCRRLVIETRAPASVLINARYECLYSLGPTDRFLRVPPGNPSVDLIAMMRDGARTKLRAAIQTAIEDNAPVTVVGDAPEDKHHVTPPFMIEVLPAVFEGEQLLLVSFVDAPQPASDRTLPVATGDLTRVAELEAELKATRSELRSAIRNLEVSSEEQMATTEEALSVNEEFQSTNEELLTSKEELQSLNEELTALNSQLQETLDRQRTAANDLQNILISTDVATIFLDASLNIRFFTPATRALFNVIQSDVGRPLADFSSLVADDELMSEAQAILNGAAAIEREIGAKADGAWYIRRIMPYRAPGAGVQGVVITFIDITERKAAAKALQAAKQQAELANVAKSRFLASASHDLRQPLQTLSLLQGLLAKRVEGEASQKLIGLFEQTLGAMSAMLNTLLDINQIDAGIVQAQKVDFPISDMLNRLQDEFSYHAQAKGLSLRVIGCSLWVVSDRQLLEQVVRNLLSNALKYTHRGAVLLGCRRHKGMLTIEVWDSGIGIPAAELQAIFEEYHQLDNAARERGRGLGLGLSIVQRLGALLGHAVHVRSTPGKGSVFSIDVALAPIRRPAQAPPRAIEGDAGRRGAILVVEDDPEIRDLIEMALTDEGHHPTVAPDATAALDLVAHGAIRPELIIADYNLPNGLNGLRLIGELRARLKSDIPGLILTGDIATSTLRAVAAENCVLINKPIQLGELTQLIQSLLHQPDRATLAPDPIAPVNRADAVIFIVDDDANVRRIVRAVLEDAGRTVEDYPSCEAFLDAYRPGREACLLIDARLPGMSGVALLSRLREEGRELPAIMITGHSEVPIAVEAMKAGAVDFIEKPIGHDALLASVDNALELSRDSGKRTAWRDSAAALIAGLSARQREIMALVLAGHPSKNIAADLGISQRTVENHRAAIMQKTGAKSLPALARLALAAG